LKPWLEGAAINSDRNLRLQYMAAWAVNNYLQAMIYDQMLLYRQFPANLIVGSDQPLQTLRRRLRPPQESDSLQ
jgi:spermidine synthase